jgi:hypothetical protein
MFFHSLINSFQKAKKNRYQQRRVLVPKKISMIDATLYYFESIEIAKYLEGVGRVQAASSVLSARKKNPVDNKKLFHRSSIIEPPARVPMLFFITIKPNQVANEAAGGW